MNPYTFRPYALDDLNFIRNSWAISAREWWKYKDWFSAETFNYYHRPIRERVLTEPTLAIIVCVGIDCQDVILGWIAVEPVHKAEGFILHYLYVKKDFRKQGIGRELFEKALPGKGPIFFTHPSEIGQAIIKEKGMNLLYAPHLI